MFGIYWYSGTHQFILFVSLNNNNDLQTWCVTEVGWGWCDPDCPTHEETLTWRKDETAKVTLQYSNSALWVGLELYGSILPWIFLLGLVLATLPPILGKVIVQSQFHIMFPSFNSSHEDCRVREVRAQYPPSQEDGRDGQNLGIVQEPYP